MKGATFARRAAVAAALALGLSSWLRDGDVAAATALFERIAQRSSGADALSPCPMGKGYTRECVFVGACDNMASGDEDDGNSSSALSYGQNATRRELQAPSFASSTSRSRTRNKIRTGTKSKKEANNKESSSAKNKAVIDVSSRVINHLDSVAISFEIPGPLGIDDWIGVYCAEDEMDPPPDHDFLDFVKTSYRSKGVFEFQRLPNMRCSWQFRLFRTVQNGEQQQHVRLAHSAYVRMANTRFEPLQIHLAMTNSPTEMRVMWVSAPVTTPEVHYGSDPNNLTRVVRASASTYAASDMCAEPASIEAAQYFRDPGALYDGLMTDLVPGSTYYYRVGGHAQKSRVYKFFVPLPAGQHDPSKPMSFFVYGDMGDWDIKALGALPDDRTGTTAKLMRDDMDSPDHQYVVAMHDGDISYARGHTFLWDQFMALIQPVAAELPYMVEVGNHDYCYTHDGANTRNDPSLESIREQKDGAFHPPNQPSDCDSGGECGVPFNKRFHMPENGNKIFWYSFEVGLMHHAVISTEHDYTPGSRMFNWLVNDLKHVDRAKTPWLFLHIHRPMYCSEMYESDFELSKYIRKNLETLCAEYGVDVVFSGHYHAYERTCPVFQEQCRTETIPSGNTNMTSFGRPLEKAKAPVHIMVGSAGASLDSAGYYAVPWSRAAQMEYGYGRMHVYNATHALYEFKRNRDCVIADSAWIISDHDWQDDILLEASRARVDQIETQNGVSAGVAVIANAKNQFVLAVDTDEDLLEDGIPLPDGDEPDNVSEADDDDNKNATAITENGTGSGAGVVALDDDLLTGKAD
ncbi:Inactive purple acid phosphatase 9, partial [Globisporangium splendens]